MKNTPFVSGWVMKNTLFYLRLGYEKYPILSQVGLWKIPYSIAGWVMKTPYSISGWVIRNTPFWVMKNSPFYLRLGYGKYPILSQVGL